MRENTAVSVQEFVSRWQQSVQVTQPTEVERVMAVWRQEQSDRVRGWWRQAVARRLVAVATRLAPNVTTGTVAAPQ